MSALGAKLRANSRTLEFSYIDLICMDQITKEKVFLNHRQEFQECEIRAIHISNVGHHRLV
jgi:hypothetical protein